MKLFFSCQLPSAHPAQLRSCWECFNNQGSHSCWDSVFRAGSILCVHIYAHAAYLSFKSFLMQPFESTTQSLKMWFRPSPLLSLIFVGLVLTVQTENGALRHEIQLLPDYPSLSLCEQSCVAGVQGSNDTRSVAFQSGCSTNLCICSLSNSSGLGPMATGCLGNLSNCGEVRYSVGVGQFLAHWCGPPESNTVSSFSPLPYANRGAGTTS